MNNVQDIDRPEATTLTTIDEASERSSPDKQHTSTLVELPPVNQDSKRSLFYEQRTRHRRPEATTLNNNR